MQHRNKASSSPNFCTRVKVETDQRTEICLGNTNFSSLFGHHLLSSQGLNVPIFSSDVPKMAFSASSHSTLTSHNSFNFDRTNKFLWPMFISLTRSVDCTHYLFEKKRSLGFYRGVNTATSGGPKITRKLKSRKTTDRSRDGRQTAVDCNELIDYFRPCMCPGAGWAPAGKRLHKRVVYRPGALYSGTRQQATCNLFQIL